MPSLIQSSFIGGEWAPEYHGRTDLPLYKHGLAQSRNMVILPQGGATRRPGSRYVANAKIDGNTVRLRRFSPANSVVYVLEFGDTYIRFYRNKAAILSGGVPFEVATPYAAADLAALGFTTDQTWLWLWHPNYAPRRLEWGGDVSWSLTTPAFTDGPYLDAVAGGSTITPAAAGSATEVLTASSIVGINGGTGFQAGDVGRAIRLQQQTLSISLTGLASGGANYNVGDIVTVAGGTYIRPAKIQVTAAAGGVIQGGIVIDAGSYLVAPSSPVSQQSTSGGGNSASVNCTFPQSGDLIWSWGTIGSRSNTQVVTVTLQALVTDALGNSVAGIFISTAAITKWRLGAWSAIPGYPRCGGLFQGRLAVGGVAGVPKRLFLSQTASHSNMAPSLGTGQVIDSSAIAVDLDDDQGDVIAWVNQAGSAQIPQLAIGTGDAEFILQAGTGGTLTPTNLNAYRETRYGSASVQPTRIGRYLLFLDRSLRRLRQWMYQYLAAGYVGPEAAPYGRHLLLAGLKEFDYALSPHPVLWGATQDGALVGLTFVIDEKDTSNSVAAWHSHQLGGSYYGGPPLIDSLCVAPSEDGSYDQLWLAVLRNDGGSVARTIEYLTPYFRAPSFLADRLPLDQAVFVDCAVSSALTLPVATCTPSFAPLYDGAGLVLRNLPQRGDSANFAFSADVAAAGDLTPGTVLRLSNGTFLLQTVTDARHVTALCLDPPSSLAPMPSGNWSYTKMATSWSGFAALNGHACAVLADGAVEPPQSIAGGIAVLGEAASYVTAGLGYASVLETLDLDLPAPDGTSQMKTGRLEDLYLRLLDSLGGRYGVADGGVFYDAIEPRGDGDLFDWAPVPVTDDIRVPMPAGASQRRRVLLRQDDPWPLTVSALVVKGGTTEQAPR